MPFFKQHGIIVEILTTVNAASTFNVLNSEGRNVAAALLTLKPNRDVVLAEEEVFRIQQEIKTAVEQQQVEEEEKKKKQASTTASTEEGKKHH